MKTIEELRKIISYDEKTGLLHWQLKPIGRMNKNGIAGCLDKDGYVSFRHNNKRYRAHRLIWALKTGNWPKGQMDHINGIRDDNRWVNLREANPRENSVNTKKRTDNTSGYKNVSWNKKRQRWRARVTDLNGKDKAYLFRTLDEAIQKAIELRILHHKEFARHT